MKIRLSLLLSTLLLSSHLPAADAQSLEERKSPAVEAEETRAELERGALGLLEEALAEAQGLKLVENRVRAQITAARLLWPRDAKTARAAFKAAADSVAELNAAVDPEDVQFYNAAQAVTQLRSELLQVAGQFDAKLALEFLRATRPSYAEAFAASGYGQPSQEQMLEVSLASQIAAQDPRQALEIAEESLGKAVTSGLMNVLNQLLAKDPAAASKLAGDIARKLRAEDLRTQYEASAVAQHLLMLTRPAEETPANSTGEVVIAVRGLTPDRAGGPALLDEQTRRELIEKVFAAVTSGAPNQGGAYNLFQAIQTLLPEVEKSAPTRAAALRRSATPQGG